MSDYPEHEKMHEVADESQAIGEFIEFSPYRLCEWNERHQEFIPVSKPINEILADYFEIDLNKIETEKRAMLAEMRELHNARK